MDALNSAGEVTLNAEGKQYAASYQLRQGVITVTLGSASRVMRVGGAVAVPESLRHNLFLLGIEKLPIHPSIGITSFLQVVVVIVAIPDHATDYPDGIVKPVLLI